jgi:hypothetical protein
MGRRPVVHWPTDRLVHGVSSEPPVPPSHEDLLAMLVELRERVERLEAENAELRRRLVLNSSNSSKPPSSDGLARPRPQPGKGSGTPSTYSNSYSPPGRGCPKQPPQAEHVLHDYARSSATV